MNSPKLPTHHPDNVTKISKFIKLETAAKYFRFNISLLNANTIHTASQTEQLSLHANFRQYISPA